MIKRAYEPLNTQLEPNKVLVIYGPRRVGKTTLLKTVLDHTSLRYKSDTGDDISVRQILGSQNLTQIIRYLQGYQLYAIDEAQQIPNVGMGLKIIVDHIPGIQVIATGSSSFELAGQIGEPLTGRKYTLCLYPIAQCELLQKYYRFELRQHLPDFLIYGTYPEILETESIEKKRKILNEIVNSYLLKDILSFERVKNPQVLVNLLKLLAYQVGNEVSLNELATKVGMDIKTVQRYLDLLEKAFVLQRLSGFSRNLHDEVTSKAKYYFYDTGIRNAVISQYNSIEDREDIGALWENFFFIERLKFRVYQEMYANAYFWHTYHGREIDLIEEGDGKLIAYEMKWSEKKKTAAPPKWSAAYPDAEYHVITPENYLEYIT